MSTDITVPCWVEWIYDTAERPLLLVMAGKWFGVAARSWPTEDLDGQDMVGEDFDIERDILKHFRRVPRPDHPDCARLEAAAGREEGTVA